MKKIISLVGPTASGKTDLAIKLAKKFDGFVISADSRQVYKSMNIGTGKPDLGRSKQKLGFKAYTIDTIDHFLFNIVSPDKSYSVSSFQSDAYAIINKISTHDPGLVPCIVGGTGMYIDAVAENWLIPKQGKSTQLRSQLEKHSLAYLVKKLNKLDPASAKKIDIKNRRRVIRALEFVLSEGKSFVSSQQKQKPLYESLIIGIDIPREKLYERINKRVNRMIDMGLIQEVKRLIKRYGWDAPAMNGIGYRQFQPYLDGNLSLKDAVDILKRDTRHYAKRQLTWWRRNKKIVWVTNYTQAEKTIRSFLK